MQATGGGRTTKWYTLGIWASGDGTIHRTSVPAQGDADGFIAIDTFIRSKKAAPLTSYQLRVTLYRVRRHFRVARGAFHWCDDLGRV
jgi:hypothetical protein